MKTILDKMIYKATGFDKHQALEQINKMLQNEKQCITLDLRGDDWINDPMSGLMDFIACGMMELKAKPEMVACIVHVDKIDFTSFRNKTEIDGLPYIKELGLYFYPQLEAMEMRLGRQQKQYLFVLADEIITN
jgi:hypothetical protein